MPENLLEHVFQYHALSKHGYNAYAPGPGYMDWANQPNPFRRFGEVKTLPLFLIGNSESPDYDLAQNIGAVPPARLDAQYLSQLFQDSLGLSAWKRYGDSTWALRVNPSSGNLHPTEAYVIGGPVEGLVSSAFLAHYAPKEHNLEVRSEFSIETWRSILDNWEGPVLFIVLSSVPWREAWKYGERAFRYCHHDLGHAIASVAIAASGLGWNTQLMDGVGTDWIQKFLNLDHPSGIEPEYADCLLALFPANSQCPMPPSFAKSIHFEFQGTPNCLSPERVTWPWVERMPSITAKPSGEKMKPCVLPNITLSFKHQKLSLRKIIHQRRSAVQMDGTGTMESEQFYRILERVLPQSNRSPFNVLNWDPMVHFVMFVHRVNAIEPGLYLLIRNINDERELRQKCSHEFVWEKPESCPSHIPFFKLLSGDVRSEANAVSCFQEIAADGCFSLGMVTRFRKPIETHGAWVYPRLYWECGLVGQVLYLEAEALGIRSTGIGCFFDDAVHQILGLKDDSYQSLYHFTVGHPVEDTRLITLPPYSEQLIAQRGFGSSG